MDASPATRKLLAKMTDPNPGKRFNSHAHARKEMLAAFGSQERKVGGVVELMRNLLTGRISKR
jgi:hypothetical protein